MNWFMQVFDSLTTAVMVLGEDDKCNLSNEACQVLLLKSQSVLSGKRIDEILEGSDFLPEQCRLAREHGLRIVLREVEIYLPEWQKQLLVDLTISPCNTERGQELLIELGDRKEVQKLSHDNDMLARFNIATQIVRGLAHEIKNPLGGIRGAAQLLSLEADDPETKEYSSVITQEVDRLSDLLSRMSGSNTSLKRVQIDIHEPITMIANLLKAEHGDMLELNYNFDTSLPPVEVNMDQIKQALLNLLKNAVQWSISACRKTPDEARASVTITTRAAFPEIRRTLMPQQGIRVQIQDSGPGVNHEITEQLFLPMVSRREGGTGLGLSISQEIAQSHGGFIELDELNGDSGASFSLYIPYLLDEQREGKSYA